MNEDSNIDPPSDARAPEPDATEPDAGRPAPGEEAESGPLLDYDQGEALEAHDRKHAGPGGEPDCPRCGATMVRSVEQHPAPRNDDSPFRVRLVCSAKACRAWTAYRW